MTALVIMQLVPIVEATYDQSLALKLRFEFFLEIGPVLGKPARSQKERYNEDQGTPQHCRKGYRRVEFARQFIDTPPFSQLFLNLVLSCGCPPVTPERPSCIRRSN